MSKRIPLILFFASLAGVLIWIGHVLQFSVFMLYDDEGYILITLRDFGRHGSLYDQVYSQYGPAFYLFYDTLRHLLGFEWTNTTGRWITLANWSGTAGLCAWLVWRASKSWPLAAFVLTTVFTSLWIMVREPMHPGSTITLWVAGTAWLGWECIRAGRTTWFAVVIGLAGAFLSLTKINVGVFLILSGGFWLLLGSEAGRTVRGRMLLAGAGLILPALLMQALIHEAWVQMFALVGGLAVAGAVLGAAPAARPLAPGRSAWAWFIGTGLGFTAVVVGLLATRGTSPIEFWHGVFMAPLKHPAIYAAPVKWRPETLWVSLGCTMLVVIAKLRPDDRLITLLIAWTKVLATALFSLTLLPQMADILGFLGLCYGLPLAALFAWPLQHDEAGTAGRQARAWLALLMVFQALHAYPVAGSQVNWGTFLWIPLLGLGLHEAMGVLLAARHPRLSSAIRGAVFALLLTLTGYMLWTFVQISRFARDTSAPLGVPGAENIGLPAHYSSALGVLTENARAHGDILISLPGSYSLNLWSGVDTPTLTNATHWFSLFTPEQQEAMIRRMDASPRSIFIVQHNILADLIGHGFHPKGPLLAYLRASFRRAFSIDGYTFWIRNARSIAPLSTGTLQPAKAGDAGPMELTLTLDRHPGLVDRVELRTVIGQPLCAAVLNTSNTAVTITPLNLDNTPAGGPRNGVWPLPLSKISRLTLIFPNNPTLAQVSPNILEAVLIDAAGKRLASARILPLNGLDLPPEARPAEDLLNASAPPAAGSLQTETESATAPSPQTPDVKVR